MSMFRIIQELPYEYIGDDYLDYPDLTLGYVEDELFAQEFCDKHKDCSYEPIISTRHFLHLECEMVEDVDEVILLKIPYKKGEWCEEE